MSDGEDGSLRRAGLGVVLSLTNLVVAVAAGVATALRGIVWLPDALVGVGLVAEVTTPVVVASMLVVFLGAGVVMYAVLMLGLGASNALAELLGFELREAAVVAVTDDSRPNPHSPARRRDGHVDTHRRPDRLWQSRPDPRARPARQRPLRGHCSL